MDPALWEAIRESQKTGEKIEAIVRLENPNQNLPDARIVSRFGRFATVRLEPGAVLRTHRRVRSLKAARLVSPGREPDIDDSDAGKPSRLSDQRRKSDLPYDGSSIIVAAADWSFDFNHPNLRKSDGTTRILAMWDQRDAERNEPLQPYGYGVLHTREDINRALASPDPYAKLNYYPGDTDVHCSGSHGTHVIDIAAGSGAIGPAGIAPNADLVLVHLADRGTRGLANLGDSVRIMEAVDFISRTAGNRSWVVNLSVGRHGGPHNGRTLVEMSFDELLAERPGRFIVQSAGNYQGKDIHSCGRLHAGETRELGIFVDKADYTPNELEIWTSAGTELRVEVESPTRVVSPAVLLGESMEIVENGASVGTIYNRAADPNSNRDNHVNLFLYPAAPPGFWKIRLRADAVSDGIYHAWLERDDACSTCQTRFAAADVNEEFTTGTLANSRHPLVVGAYNNHSGRREIASFSSSGPTRDGRMKPDVLAPGVRIIAARSRGPHCNENYRPLTRKSGTSMAAPHVTGTVALLMQSSKKPLWSHEIRELVLRNTDPATTGRKEQYRAGHGYLNIPKLMRAVQAKRGGFVARPATEKHMITTDAARTDIDAEAIFERVRDKMDSNPTVEGYNVIAWPGKAPDATPQVGDILVRVAEGEPGIGNAYQLESAELLSHEQAAHSPIAFEGRQAGLYAPVTDLARPSWDSGVARQILQADGTMPGFQMLVRPARESDDCPADDVKAGERGTAKLSFPEIHKAVGGDGYPHLYYVTTGARGRGRDPAIVKLRIRNPNDHINYERGMIRTRLRNIQTPGIEDKVVKTRDGCEWLHRRVGTIVDESSKTIALRLSTPMLRRAHDSDSPRTSLDVQYLYDERWRHRKRWEYYSQHHLSFFLVDPIEVLWKEAKLIKDEIKLTKKEHRRFWTLVHQKTFRSFDRTPTEISTQVSSSASYSRGGQIQFTNSNTTENGQVVSTNISQQQGASGKIGISDIIELGLENKTTVDLGVEKSFKTIKSFSKTIALSETLTREFKKSKTVKRTLKSSPGWIVTMWVYPVVALYEVPIVIFDGINELGQSTRRTRVENIPIYSLIGWGDDTTRKRIPGWRPRRRRTERKQPTKHCPPEESDAIECEAQDSAITEFVISSRTRAWQHLIGFRPPHSVQLRVHNRSRFPRWNIHKIEDGAGDLNLDYYPVSIARLPMIAGRRVSAEELLEHVRININSFVDTRVSRFTPYSRSDRRVWLSSNPLGAVIHIDMGIFGGRINPDDGSVVCSQYHADNWIFSTIWTTGDMAHPVSGNRQFGFMGREGGGYIFFTRAADRITRSIDLAMEGLIWNGADRLWRSFQSKLANFVNSNSGVAVRSSSISGRHNWPTMKRRFHRPTTTWRYP